MEEDCPVCGETFDRQGLANHIRLTNGRGHGPAGSMPDDVTEGNGDHPTSTEPIHATNVEAQEPQTGEDTSVQEAINQAFDAGASNSRQVNSRIATLEQRVEELEELIQSMKERTRQVCPNCGHDDPQPMEGDVAEAYADLDDSFDWVCPNCHEPYNSRANSVS